MTIPVFDSFRVYDGDEYFADVSGPRETAWAEAKHYASQCERPRIEEVLVRPAVECPSDRDGPIRAALEKALPELEAMSLTPNNRTFLNCTLAHLRKVLAESPARVHSECAECLGRGWVRADAEDIIGRECPACNRERTET